MSTYGARSGLQDAAQTFQGSQLTLGVSPGFFKGRTFRAYREFTGAAVLRLVATKPFLLTAQTLACDTGAAKVVISVGSTPGGTFVALPTVYNKNGVTVPTVAQDIVITQNGTASGGTEREVIRAAVAGAGVSRLEGPRLLPAGTYYFNLTVTGSTSGVYSIEWEELDS